MPTSDFQASQLRDLRERHQRLDEIVRRMEAQYDRETRVEERLRLEPLILEKKGDRDQVEAEIRQLEVEDASPPRPPLLFYCYAHEDEPLRDELAKHVKLLERQGVLETWHDRSIRPGTDWHDAIKKALGEADIILLLVSADFMASDYIWSQELKLALERHERGEARVIPILLRPTDWQDAPFSHLQALPRDARPVRSWADRDEAFAGIARALREVACSASRRR